MAEMQSSVDRVIDFWFHTLKPAQWFRKDPELDAQRVPANP
jgi:uncharacterized protein (DUF924 family)